MRKRDIVPARWMLLWKITILIIEKEYWSSIKAQEVCEACQIIDRWPHLPDGFHFMQAMCYLFAWATAVMPNTFLMAVQMSKGIITVWSFHIWLIYTKFLLISWERIGKPRGTLGLGRWWSDGLDRFPASSCVLSAESIFAFLHAVMAFLSKAGFSTFQAFLLQVLGICLSMPC